MWFFKQPAKRPEIPRYQETPLDLDLTPRKLVEPKGRGIVVEEVDTSAMTSTGVHKAWRRLAGRQD